MSRSPISSVLNPKSNSGFTLVELLVSVAIFTIMTALVVAKYGTFNQSVLLTNLAYDVAITIRTAQTYGLSVRNTDTSSTDFKSPYGVHFSTATGANDKMLFFADDGTDDGIYDNSDRLIGTYTLKRGAIISGFCSNQSGCTNLGTGVLDVSFKRPDPDAIICYDGSCDDDQYMEIVIRGTDGDIRSVTVRSNGQISVKN